jgi:hypothetical protein
MEHRRLRAVGREIDPPLVGRTPAAAWRFEATKAIRLVILGLTVLQLSACQADLFLGYGLPHNAACRDADNFPGKPIGSDCLDSLGR